MPALLWRSNAKHISSENISACPPTSKPRANEEIVLEYSFFPVAAVSSATRHYVDEAILAEVLSPCDDEPAKLYADVGSAQGRLGA